MEAGRACSRNPQRKACHAHVPLSRDCPQEDRQSKRKRIRCQDLRGVRGGAGWHAWVSAGLPSGRGWQTHLLRLPPSPCPCEWGRRRPGSSAKLPNRGSSPLRPSGGGVRVGASQHQPFSPRPRVPSDPQPRNRGKGGAYLRLRSVWLVQRAPISAATPGSLMELLCRL